MPTLTERLSGYSRTLSGNDLPPSVIQSAVDAIIDTVACGLGGSRSAIATSVHGAMEAPGDTQRGYSLLGGGMMSTQSGAAFVNATAAHALELDDTDAKGFCHPGAVVIPAALTAAENVRTSGEEFLLAVIIGYDASVRLARWVNPEHRLRGFHTTATIPTIGAAATVARLRGMSMDETASAMGIAASFASGTFEFVTSGSNLKRVHAGKAAASAIMSCDLAQHGVEGPATALEGTYGFYASAVGGEPKLLNLEDLGHRFMIQEVGRKSHPCCRFCHTAIDAAIELHGAGIPSQRLSSIEVAVSQLCFEQTRDVAPTNELQRQFSTPYGVALGLLRGAAKLPDYQDVPDTEALGLARQVEMVIDPDLPIGHRAATVSITSEDGRLWRARLQEPRGEPNNPLAADGLREKFMNLSSSQGSPAGSTQLYEALQNLAAMDDISDVYRHLRNEE